MGRITNRTREHLGSRISRWFAYEEIASTQRVVPIWQSWKELGPAASR